MLNGQIGNTAAGIHLIGRYKGLGWADVQTPRAPATMIDLRSVRLQIQRGKNRPQKHPISGLPADQIRMLALPAQPRCLPQGLFGHWGGVHEDFNFATTFGNQPTSQTL